MNFYIYSFYQSEISLLFLTTIKKSQSTAVALNCLPNIRMSRTVKLECFITNKNKGITNLVKFSFRLRTK